MRILIGCDVDAVLPALLTDPPSGDVWAPLDRIHDLLSAMGQSLPPITWLIRSDESIQFCTGEYASGYTSRGEMWSELLARGHELGWHMHLISHDQRLGAFLHDPRPRWLGAAHAALASRFAVRATRTGWDYGSCFLFGELERLGIEIDFSALPGNRIWHHVGPSTIGVDWLNCPQHAYHPSAADYQRPGADGLKLIEVPIAQFRNSLPSMVKRYVWRLLHGCSSPRGLHCKTRLITDAWDELPFSPQDVWAFFFHPEDLTPRGIHHFRKNVERLKSLSDAEFVTAGEVRRWHDSQANS